MSPRILGIIPARGGSKSVPRKNIKLLDGKPLLAYVLGAALKSKYFSRVVVSSEDDEILAIARKFGGDTVSLLRPKELALDTTPDVPMLKHAIEQVEKEEGKPFDYVVQLHATTPFTTTADIDGALKKLLETPDADSIVSVFKINHYHPIKLKKIVHGYVEPYVEGFGEKTTSRRQDLDNVYRRNGGIYASKRSVVMELGRVFGDKCLAYEMPYERSFEVDTKVDFLIADYLMKHLREHENFEI